MGSRQLGRVVKRACAQSEWESAHECAIVECVEVVFQLSIP